MTHDQLAAECLKYGHTLPTDLPHNCLYRLCHHEVLFEFVGNPYERIEYIVTMKPEHERATRLREFVHIPFAVGDAKARADYDKAWADLAKALADYDKAWADLAKARADYAKAWADLDKAITADERAAIIALVPDTKWDGRTIFSEAV